MLAVLLLLTPILASLISPLIPTDSNPLQLSAIVKLYDRHLYPRGLDHCPHVATPCVTLEELTPDLDLRRTPVTQVCRSGTWRKTTRTSFERGDTSVLALALRRKRRV